MKPLSKASRRSQRTRCTRPGRDRDDNAAGSHGWSPYDDRHVVRKLAAPATNWVAIAPCTAAAADRDRKSTRLNSSHSSISYAVFCLKKKKKKNKKNIKI